MIIINKNSTNNIVVTCSELMQDPVDNYIAIKFTNDITYEEVNALLQENISPSIGRYDEFVIVETTVPNIDPEEGIINFNRLGHWKYDCYEWPYAEQWDPTLIETFKLVETGRCLVQGDLSNVDEVYK